jgi:hypothetical protein
MGNYSSKDGTGNPIPDEVIPSRAIRSNNQAQSNQVQQNRTPPDSTQSVINASSILINGVLEPLVPTVFKWEHGGRHVYITGTFNNWERQIPMHRSGNDFTYVHNLPKGKHAYKFIVDDEWRFAPDQETIADVEGRINNYIDISGFAPYTGDDHFFQKSKERKIPDEDFKQDIPDLDDYTKE